MNKPNPDVDFYFSRPSKWTKEVNLLREIALDSELVEERKWNKACYTLNGHNVFLIHSFKDYCALLFHKGALLEDPNNILVQQTENVQSARQIRFTSLEQINEMQSVIQAYIHNAAEVERTGLEVRRKDTEDYIVAPEFQYKLDEMPVLRDAFEALTPGRQRAYLLYFAAPKQSKTRAARVEKSIDMILDGIGLYDNGR